MDKNITTAKEAAAQIAASIISDIVDPKTGEVLEFLYELGRPREYRFNGQKGTFSIDGTIPKGSTFSFQPVAWRFFSDALFGRARAQWAEFFFVDDQNCLSCIMFNNSSVLELDDLARQLHYARTKFSDVVLTITTGQATNEKGTWHIAKFAYEKADKEKTKELDALAANKKCPIFRADTVTDGAEYRLFSDSYALGVAMAGMIQEGQAEDIKPPLQISSQTSQAA